MRHVIIPCAGRGERLGSGLPKALTLVGGKYIAEHIFYAIAEATIPFLPEIHFVTGFGCISMVQNLGLLKAYFHHNINWNITGPANSVSIVAGQIRPHELVTIIDGDIVPDPESLKKFIEAEVPVIGYRDLSNDPSPVYIDLEGDKVTAFGDKCRRQEWACVATVPAGWFYSPTAPNLWQNLQLPCKAMKFEGIEIDTPENLKEAELWLSKRK